MLPSHLGWVGCARQSPPTRRASKYSRTTLRGNSAHLRRFSSSRRAALFTDESEDHMADDKLAEFRDRNIQLVKSNEELTKANGDLTKQLSDMQAQLAAIDTNELTTVK